jgi:hypothetical protein
MKCVACMFLPYNWGETGILCWYSGDLGKLEYSTVLKRYLCNGSNIVWKMLLRFGKYGLSVPLLYLPKAAAWYWSLYMYTYTHVFYYCLTINIIAFTSQIWIYIRWRLSITPVLCITMVGDLKPNCCKFFEAWQMSWNTTYTSGIYFCNSNVLRFNCSETSA